MIEEWQTEVAANISVEWCDIKQNKKQNEISHWEWKLTQIKSVEMDVIVERFHQLKEFKKYAYLKRRYFQLIITNHNHICILFAKCLKTG